MNPSGIRIGSFRSNPSNPQLLIYFFILIHSLMLSFFGRAIWQRYREEPLNRYWYPAFICKCLAGIALGLLYLEYYDQGGDSLNYFYDARLLARYAQSYPQRYLRLIFLDTYYYDLGQFHTGYLWNKPRVFPIVKLFSVFYVLTGGSYWLISFYFSALSAWGMWKLANALVKLSPHTKFAAVLAFLLWPSVLIWTSGISKESLALTAIGFSLSYLLELLQNSPKSPVFWLKASLIWALSMYLLLLIKFYYLAALLPWVLAYFVTLHITKYLYRKFTYTFIQTLAGQASLLMGFGLIFVLGATFLHPTLSLDYIMDAITYNHNSTYIFSNPEDLIHYQIIGVQGYISLHNSWESFIFNAPLALFSALFRPFIWEAWDSTLKFIQGFENLIVLLLSMYALYPGIRYISKQAPSARFRNTQLLMLSALLYIILLYTILAFASPNFGSLVRYKVAAYPIYLYLILIPWNQSLGKLGLNEGKKFRKSTPRYESPN